MHIDPSQEIKTEPAPGVHDVVTAIIPLSPGELTDQTEASTEPTTIDQLDDKRHPYNWSWGKRAYCAGTMCLAMTNSTLSSSMPGGTLPYIADYFDISQSAKASLPSTVFLLGYVVGPLLFSPLSEQYGRRPVMLVSFGLFLACSLGCTLAPTFGALVGFRLLAGMGGSASISVIGGVYADIFESSKARGQATAMYTVLTTVGTVTGPIIYGYISLHGWRWAFGLSTILAGITYALILFLPETFAPVIFNMSRSPSPASASSEKAESNQSFRWKPLLTAVSRPLHMFFTEAIVFFSSVYVAFVFAVLFLFFQAYITIFRDLYGLPTSTATLAFLPMVPGTLLSWPLTILYDRYYARRREHRRRLKQYHQHRLSAEPNQHAPPQADDHDEEDDDDDRRRLPIACLASPLLPISLFWLAWTASPGRIHYVVPMLSGLPFSVALVLVISVFFNYLTDSYVTFAASALAAASCARSLLGAVLPLAADPMYAALGVGWGTSVLGFVALALVPVPFVFLRYGRGIRERSRFCRVVAEEGRMRKRAGRRESGRSGGEI